MYGLVAEHTEPDGAVVAWLPLRVAASVAPRKAWSV